MKHGRFHERLQAVEAQWRQRVASGQPVAIICVAVDDAEPTRCWGDGADDGRVVPLAALRAGVPSNIPTIVIRRVPGARDDPCGVRPLDP